MRAAEALAAGAVALSLALGATVARGQVAGDAPPAAVPAVDDPTRLGIPRFIDPPGSVYAPPTPRAPSGAPYEPEPDAPDPDPERLGQPRFVAPGEGPVYAPPTPRAPSGAPYEPEIEEAVDPGVPVTPLPRTVRDGRGVVLPPDPRSAVPLPDIGLDPLYEVTIGVDPSDYLEPDPTMRSALHRAARVSADPALIALLVARGADPNARDAEGRTPLHEAAANPVAAAALLEAGADPCATDVRGAPALDASTLAAIGAVAPEAYPAAVAAFVDCP